MNNKEKEFIKMYDTYKTDNGYNMSPGGEYQTDDKKRKTSISVSKHLMGHIYSDETKNKISKALKGRKHTNEAREKMKEHWSNHENPSFWTNKTLSDEHKEAIRLGSIVKKKPVTSAAMKKRRENYRNNKSTL